MAEPSQDEADAAVESEDTTTDAALRVVSAGSTAVGQVREHNEDNFVVANLRSNELRPRDENSTDDIGDCGMMFAVCDGMGGAAAGEVASQMAVDILVEAMRRGGAPPNRDSLARRLVQAVEESGRRIFEAAQKERSRRGMGTTATVAVLADKVLFLAEVGDSRAYLLRRGVLKQLTKDQSLVNQLIEAGHLTEDEAEAFEHSNIILQALGTSESVQVDLTFVELRQGDRLMLCSDGLSGLVHADTLRSALEEIEDPSEACARLIEYAEGGGGHDNITVIVADFDGSSLSEATDSDSFGYVQYPLPLEDEDSSAFVEETTAGGGRPSEADESADDVETVAPPRRSVSVPPPEANRSRTSALWIALGVFAIALAGAVWGTLETGEQDAPEAIVAEEPPPEEPAAPEEVTPVEVNVHTDVDSATLLVNGEARGDLAADQSRSLQLKPGAYRFEAQAEGSPVAVTVVTVRGDMPMDVFLRRPQQPTHVANEDPVEGDGEAAPPEDEGGAELAAKPEEQAPASPEAAKPKVPAEELDPEVSARRAEQRRLRRERRRQERAERAARQAAAAEASEEQAEAPPAVSEPTPAAAAAAPQEIPDNPF
ncbi:MAG: Stp1/IreP family PP2C-type Ser/Thr phosphatase [Myxococcales bacterium]|nr:Stp1/IreP family PP2C-type Ser/Thr phosphatase [Myxococcales bacterium]